MKYSFVRETIEKNIEFFIKCLKDCLEKDKKDIAITFYYRICGCLYDLRILDYITYTDEEIRKKEVWNLIYNDPIE